MLLAPIAPEVQWEHEGDMTAAPVVDSLAIHKPAELLVDDRLADDITAVMCPHEWAPPVFDPATPAPPQPKSYIFYHFLLH